MLTVEENRINIKFQVHTTVPFRSLNAKLFLNKTDRGLENWAILKVP